MPPVLLNPHRFAAGGGGVGTGTLTIPGRAATRADFVTLVDLADLDTAWWAGVETGGANIRVKASGADQPVDVVASSIDTGAETGILYFKATLGTSANVFTIETTPGLAAPATTDPIGRNAVWSNYHRFIDFWELVDRKGSGASVALAGTASIGGGLLDTGAAAGQCDIEVGGSTFNGTHMLTAMMQFDTIGAQQTVIQLNGTSNHLHRMQMQSTNRLDFENDFNANQLNMGTMTAGVMRLLDGSIGVATAATRSAFVNGTQVAAIAGSSRLVAYGTVPESLTVGGDSVGLTSNRARGKFRQGGLLYGALTDGPAWLADRALSWLTPASFYAIS